MASRRKSFENKKSIVKQEPIPDVNMEDSPPLSDSDVSIRGRSVTNKRWYLKAKRREWLKCSGLWWELCLHLCSHLYSELSQRSHRALLRGHTRILAAFVWFQVTANNLYIYLKWMGKLVNHITVWFMHSYLGAARVRSSSTWEKQCPPSWCFQQYVKGYNKSAPSSSFWPQLQNLYRYVYKTTLLIYVLVKQGRKVNNIMKLLLGVNVYFTIQAQIWCTNAQFGKKNSRLFRQLVAFVVVVTHFELCSLHQIWWFWMIYGKWDIFKANLSCFQNTGKLLVFCLMFFTA